MLFVLGLYVFLSFFSFFDFLLRGFVVLGFFYSIMTAQTCFWLSHIRFCPWKWVRLSKYYFCFRWSE